MRDVVHVGGFADTAFVVENAYYFRHQSPFPVVPIIEPKRCGI
jgi:hypothetical protein